METTEYTTDEIILALVLCLGSLHSAMNDFKPCSEPECSICELIKTAKDRIGRA